MRKLIMNILEGNNCYTVWEIYNIVIETGWTPPRGGATPKYSCSSELTRLWKSGTIKRRKHNGIFVYFI